MAHNVQTKVTDSHVQCVLVGDNSPEALSECFSGCLAACKEAGKRIALVEDRLIGPDLELSSLFEVIKPAADAALGVLDLVCYVKTTPGHDPNVVRFGENIASNREVNARVFRTVEAAERFIAASRR